MADGRRSFGARIGASLRGEVPADEVLARLSAAGGVYDDYFAADRLRDELVLAGIDPAHTSPAESSQLLCTWIAYASVSLAQAFVDAEGVDPARGPGFLPPVSADQALLLLRDVPAWSARARRAAQERGYDVAAEVRLPVPLPWVVVEPCPRSHLEAMQQAGSVMLERIEAALGDMERLARSPSPVLGQLRGMAVDAHARLEYASRLASAAAGGRVHEGVENALREGVTACWTLGQVLGRPRLAAVAAANPQPVSVAPPTPSPGSPPWGSWNGAQRGYGDRGHGHGYGHHGYGHH